jgi:hypothetical protein
MSVSINIKLEFTIGLWRVNVLTIAANGQGWPQIELFGICHETMGYEGYFSIERYLIGYGFYTLYPDDNIQSEGYRALCIDFLFIRFSFKQS